MTTHQVANRLVELCRQGKVLEAQEELFSDDVESIEPAGSQGAPNTKGKEAALEKGKYFANMIEEVHGAEISEPVVGGNHFAISWSMDVTMKEKGRSTMDEVCVYHVKDGKIASEQFFYAV